MVDGVLACLERPEAVGQAFNIGNPRSAVTIYDLAQRIKRLDRRARARSCSRRSTTPTSSCGSRTSTKARELLGWEPQVELDDGLARTIAWYREKQPASV